MTLAEYSRALSTFSPVFSGLLRKEQNESDYQGCENCGSIESAKGEPALVNRLVDQIAQSGA
jgi:hypothetical protein